MDNRWIESSKMMQRKIDIQKIEYDYWKDLANQRKHGISLNRANDFLWDDATYEGDTRRDYGEERINALGYIAKRLYSLTFTRRNGSTRVISLRKANKRELRNYLSRTRG